MTLEDWLFEHLGKVIAVVLLAGVISLWWHHRHHEQVQLPAAYAAWCKHTGNPNHLTYDEWRAMLRAEEPRTSTTFVPAPVIIHR